MAVAYLGEQELVEVDVQEFVTTFTLLYEEVGEIREVKLYKGLYDKDTKKWRKDTKQEESFYENISNLFGAFHEDELQESVGKKFPVYDSGQGWSSFWEPKSYAKFGAEMIGEMVTGVFKAFNVYETKTVIVVEVEGEDYVSNLNYGKWVESLQKSLLNPAQKERQLEKFQEKFGVPFHERESLIGKTVNGIVRKNPMDKNGKNPTWLELMKLPKRK